MATNGASPTYFDYDAFDEIQISTGGNDIRQATGGVGLNFVVKRGTQPVPRHGARLLHRRRARSDEPARRAARARRDAGDRRPQPADHRGRRRRRRPDPEGQAVLLGLDRASRTSASTASRRAAPTARSSRPTTPRSTGRRRQKDMVNFLFFNGDKIKNGRAPGQRALRADLGALQPGQLLHRQPAARPVEVGRQPRVSSSNWFVTGKYAYYNTGFTLESIGPLTEQMGISAAARPDVRLDQRAATSRGRSTRSTSTATTSRRGATPRTTSSSACGWRRTDIFARTIYPGNGIVAYENSATDFRARVYREGAGHQPRARTSTSTSATRSALGRLTLDLGVRYDRQWGEALASRRSANAAFPNLVPGINFAGYDAPFHWNDITPRVGMTYALDEDAQDDPPRQLQPQRRPADGGRHLHRLRQPELARGLGRVSVDRRQRRSPGADQRGAGQPAAPGVGQRLQHGESDVGGLGQP